MAEFTNQSLKFHSDELGEDTLLISKMVGTERISGPFHFALELVSNDPNVDLGKVLYAPCKIGIEHRLGAGLKTFRWYHGVLEEFQELEQSQGWTRYYAVMVPQFQLLDEFYRSRIFMKKTAEEMVTDVMKKSLGLQPGTDFEFSLSRDQSGDRKTRAIYPEHEYVVQYEETDFNFVNRWLEHEGIFYFFENDGTCEKVVFADGVSAYKPVVTGASPAYPYRPQGRSQSTGASENEGGAPAQEILSFTCRHSRQPNKVTLNDYNWRDPGVRLSTGGDVAEDGIGVQNEYNDHYKSEAQGAALAQVRIEEWSCRSAMFTGMSTCRTFRPGKTFDLEEHFRGDFNDSYLLVEVVHTADQSINLEASTVTGANYSNSFVAIPAAKAFRPERLSEWPSISGVMHAKVDAEGDGAYAELDEHGRYKISIPFDENQPDATPGEASRWVRMATPYAGVNSGMHFPLLKETEVLITHIDGDPDRPIIASAVPNPERVSPVHQGNAHQNRIQTSAGNLILMDDGDSTGFAFVDGSGRYIDDQRQPVGATNPGDGAAPGYGGGLTPTATRRPAKKPAKPAKPEPKHPMPAFVEAAAAKAVSEPVAAADPAPAADAPAPAAEAPAETPEAHAERRETLEGYSDAYKAFAAACPKLTPELSERWFGPGQGGELIEATDGDHSDAAHANTQSVLDALTALNASDVGTAVNTGLSTMSGKGAPTSSPYVFTGRIRGNVMLVDIFDNSVTVKKGDAQYTYGDVSNAYSWGTGGYSYSNTDGDDTNESEHFGHVSNNSLRIGNEDSFGITIGGKASFGLTIDAIADASIHVGGKASFSLDVGRYESISLELAGKNSFGLTIGYSNAIDITIANRSKLEIDVGMITEMSIAAGVKTTIDTGISKEEITIPSKNEYGISDAQNDISYLSNRLMKTESELNATKNQLNETENQLNKTKNALNDTNNKLNETENKLNQTENKLNQTENKLNETNNQLNDTKNALASNTQAMSESITALSTLIN